MSGIDIVQRPLFETAEDVLSRHALSLDPEVYSAFLHLILDLQKYRSRDRELLLQMSAAIAGPMHEHSFSAAKDAIALAQKIFAEVDGTASHGPENE